MAKKVGSATAKPKTPTTGTTGGGQLSPQALQQLALQTQAGQRQTQQQMVQLAQQLELSKVQEARAWQATIDGPLNKLYGSMNPADGFTGSPELNGMGGLGALAPGAANGLGANGLGVNGLDVNGLGANGLGVPATTLGTPATTLGVPAAGVPATTLGMPATGLGMPATGLGMPATGLATPGAGAPLLTGLQNTYGGLI
ncbi:MAG: hypothetical protein HY319_06830 [Armatimonadetes bacterium]|nr:hypothetical protein [Armatimonadota bacterium]